MTPNPGELARALAFVRGVDERASSRVETFRFGTAYLRPELPAVWSRNFVWVDTPVDERDVAPLAGEADGILARAGVDHRRLVFAGAGGSPPRASSLENTGWRVQDTIVMTHHGDVGVAAAHSADVCEVDSAAVRPAAEAMARANPNVRGEHTVEQLMTAFEVLEATTNQRRFAAIVDGAVASFCRLYSEGETAQIEEVSTVPAYRGQGLSRAVVTTALAAATSTHALTFLLADEDDWPRGWYERIGFRRIGAMREAIKA